MHVVISAGSVYHFDGVTVNGLRRLHPSFVTKRFTRLSGKTYSPDVLDERFGPDDSEVLLRSVGRRLVESKTVPTGGTRARLEAAAGVLNELGGLAEVEEQQLLEIGLVVDEQDPLLNRCSQRILPRHRRVGASVRG